MNKKQVTEMKERSNSQLQVEIKQLKADLEHAHGVIDQMGGLTGKLQAELFSSTLRVQALEQQKKNMEHQMMEAVMKQQQEAERQPNRQQRRHGQ